MVWEHAPFLLANKFYQTNLDNFMFIKKTTGTFTLLLLYVDDIIMAGNSLIEFDKIEQVFHHTFQIKNLGKLNYFLVLEATHSKKGIIVWQRKHFLDLTYDTWFLGSKPITTPTHSANKLMNDTKPIYTHIPTYRCRIGRLLNLTPTRPYITFITNVTPR